MEINIENKIFLISYENKSLPLKKISKKNDLNQIQFYFNLKGEMDLLFNENYSIKLEENKCLILYNSKKALNLNAKLHNNSKIISFIISLKEMHNLLSNQDIYIPTIINIKEKYYEEIIISDSILFVLNQIMNSNGNMNTQKLFIKAKIYETFSLLFQSNESKNSEKCPFILNNDTINKIKEAKNILVKDISKTPTLYELSQDLDISLKKLKTGFKEIYGHSVYQYALNNKLEFAKNLLIKGKNNVNEVSLMIGYSSSSHFIAAFKKKYGVTPSSFVKNS